MNGIVLDTGALIALERSDRTLWAVLKWAALKGKDVVVPSAALAQVWRGTANQAQLSRALHHAVIASFDAVVRDVGELCGRTKNRDICDAQVAIVASRMGEFLYTSDPSAMRRLTAVLPGKKPAIVRC